MGERGACATTLPPAPDDDAAVEDLRLLEWLAMRRPYVWDGAIEDERLAANDAVTVRPEGMQK